MHFARTERTIPASAGKAKAGMVHSVSGWTRGLQVKLWDPLRSRAIPERLRGVFTTRRYTNPRLPLPYLYHANSGLLSVDIFTLGHMYFKVALEIMHLLYTVGQITSRYSSSFISTILNNKLSYRRETALPSALVFAKSGRMGLGDDILRTL